MCRASGGVAAWPWRDREKLRVASPGGKEVAAPGRERRWGSRGQIWAICWSGRGSRGWDGVQRVGGRRAPGRVDGGAIYPRSGSPEDSSRGVGVRSPVSASMSRCSPRRFPSSPGEIPELLLPDSPAAQGWPCDLTWPVSGTHKSQCSGEPRRLWEAGAGDGVFRVWGQRCGAPDTGSQPDERGAVGGWGSAVSAGPASAWVDVAPAVCSWWRHPPRIVPPSRIRPSCQHRPPRAIPPLRTEPHIASRITVSKSPRPPGCGPGAARGSWFLRGDRLLTSTGGSTCEAGQARPTAGRGSRPGVARRPWAGCQQGGWPFTAGA